MTKADSALIDEVDKLRALPVADLRARYLELFGEETTSRNKDYIFKRIAYRLQERKYGGLTPRARARAELLAEDAPIRRRLSPNADAPEVVHEPPSNRDPRLPPAGTELRRPFDGTEHVVTVLDDGFTFRGKQYRSLSLIAREITGTRWNGYGFFGLLRKESA
ncbi:MAG: DUF2924 domain-containing protein [Planctomycetota bacterium]